MKTDKRIIADLPDKTEVKTFCPLSRKQAALYQQAVDDLAGQLEDVDGMKRRGIVLAFLMRLKQICNHPSQCPQHHRGALRLLSKRIVLQAELARVLPAHARRARPLTARCNSPRLSLQTRR
jgi:hypothetical protein